MNKNQTPTEENAVVATGRKGLEKAVAAMQSDIMAVAAPSVRSAGDTWLQRAIISVVNDDNPKVRECLQSKTGQLSIIKCFEQAATMGLQLGGQFKHGHLTAFEGKAELIVDQNGYKFMTCHGHGAVLKDIAIRRVYEGEQFKIDFSANTVEHSYDGKAERGKLVGVYGILTKLDGDQVVEYMTRAEALRIRDAHSRGWQAFKAGRTKDNFWNTDEDAAIEKTAAKKFLRPFAAKSEGLAMLYSSEDDIEPADYQPPPRDVSDRMAAHLESKAERIDAAPVIVSTPHRSDDPIKSSVDEAEVVKQNTEPAGTVELF
jgi:recombinational DNA repair protein RecT